MHDELMAERVTPLPVGGIFPVVGVSVGDRQHLVSLLKPDDQVTLHHDPANPHDPDAVEVRAADGQVLGFVPRTIAARVSAHGEHLAGRVVEVVGGGTGSFGLRVQLDSGVDIAADCSRVVLSPGGVRIGEFVGESDGFVRVRVGASSVQLRRESVTIVDAAPAAV